MNNTELVQSYRQQIANVVNQANLQLFWNMYNRCGRHSQRDLPCSRPRDGAGWMGGGFLPRVAGFLGGRG